MKKMKTKKIKKVLIALDYDPTAQKVAEAGFLLAKNIGAEVTLLHVIVDPVYYTAAGHVTIMGFAGVIETEPFEKDNVEQLMEASQIYLDKSKEHLGDNTIQTKIKEGDFADCILNTAKELHADIIVMGSHSKKWLENIVMGSITEKVLRQTKIPLFIIPTKKH
jgi:nucleotide-binding universal stress UspA family protein